MKLPNWQHAFIDIAKLRNYCLNPNHKEGKHKARVFAAALGIGPGDAEWLRDQLLQATTYDCEPGLQSAHGRRYVIDFFSMRGDERAQIHSAWIVRNGESFPRLITCYVL